MVSFLLLNSFHSVFFFSFYYLGIPDNLRPLCWRLFLDYLPRDRHSWANVLQKQRSYYENLVENLIIYPSSISTKNSVLFVEEEVDDHVKFLFIFSIITMLNIKLLNLF